MNHLVSLPPHIWARVLRGATMRDLCVVAHVCRALHVLVTSHDRCLCTSDGGPFVAPGEKEHARTRAFWAHLRGWRVVPSQCEWNACIQLGFVVRVALALRCGVDPAIEDQRALCEASANGHVAVVDLLLRDERVDPSAGTQTPVCDASERGHAPVVERLLRDPRVDPSIYFQWPLVRACEHGHSAVVECLLRDERVQPSVLGQTPLSTACRKGHLSVVERLLSDERVDPGAKSQMAVRLASARGHVAIVERLLCDERVDPRADEQCAVRWASMHGHVAVVRRLLRDERVSCDVAALRACISLARAEGNREVLRCLRDYCRARGE